MAISLVQHSFATGDALDTTLVISPLSAIGSGNLLYVAAYVNNGTATMSVSDGTNSYTAIDDNTGGVGLRLVNFYFNNSTSGPTSVTVTYGSGGSDFRRAHFFEFSGVNTTAPLDAHSISAASGQPGGHAGPGTGTDGVTSDSVTTTANGELIIGSAISGGAGNLTQGTGFTAGDLNTGGLCSEWMIQSSSGTGRFVTFTAAVDGSVNTSIATFIAAAGGASAAQYVPPVTEGHLGSIMVGRRYV